MRKTLALAASLALLLTTVPALADTQTVDGLGSHGNSVTLPVAGKYDYEFSSPNRTVLLYGKPGPCQTQVYTLLSDSGVLEVGCAGDYLIVIVGVGIDRWTLKMTPQNPPPEPELEPETQSQPEPQRFTLKGREKKRWEIVDRFIPAGSGKLKIRNFTNVEYQLVTVEDGSWCMSWTTAGRRTIDRDSGPCSEDLWLEVRPNKKWRIRFTPID